VCVLVLTYNHGRFIETAIRSVLTQQLPDDIELAVIVGEDASQDGTREVVARMAANNPVITAVLRETNVGMIENFADIWRRADADYVAVLEGDDYWTDARKLSRQVEAMNEHPEWSMSFHRARWVDSDGNDLDVVFPWPQLLRKGINGYTLARYNFVPTPSVMYRGGIVAELPGWLAPLKLADWPVHLLHAAAGEVGFLDIEAAAYRVHAEGVWSMQPTLERHQAVAQMATAFVTNAKTAAQHAIGGKLHSDANRILAGQLHRAGQVQAARGAFRTSLRYQPLSLRQLNGRSRTAALLLVPPRLLRRVNRGGDGSDCQAEP
jgi:hypothetical protein